MMVILDILEDVAQQTVGEVTLSAESLHQLPDVSQNRLEALLAGREANHGDLTGT
jgi:hypothetical protein